jgi:hypothetical protein
MKVFSFLIHRNACLSGVVVAIYYIFMLPRIFHYYNALRKMSLF